MNPAAASHVHFDRTKPLILLYPPVFCVGGQRVDLEYDATQFADVGDVLTAEQSQPILPVMPATNILRHTAPENVTPVPEKREQTQYLRK